MTKQKLRIAIVTSGRFHVCDLARELTLLGHDVQFYSLVPPRRTKRFGLPAASNRWLLPRIAHRAAAYKLLVRTRLRHRADEGLHRAIDTAAAKALEPCDVFIDMSGLCNLAAVRAKHFGARVWIERGSRHILSQKEILDRIPGAETVPEFSVRRELRDYAHADVISLLSQHCVDSFVERGVPPDRLVRNPLGVNLDMFPPTPAPPTAPPTVLMAGTWSLQKGCDVLVAAWRRLSGVRLVHVGSVGDDCPLPTDPGFEHLGKVDQTRLPEVYARFQVMALASRQEGLATVQPQGLASGLRLVCTDRTGGADLADMLPDRRAVRVVPTDDPEALAVALAESLRDAKTDTGIRDRLGPAKGELTWAAYARRYEANLYERM
ncbi:MAG: glycosyltransferase family 4 protein [Gemmataceae bacterium]